MPLNTCAKIYNKDSLRAATFHAAFASFAAGHTGADDVKLVLKDVEEAAAQAMAGKYGTIVIDGASSKHRFGCGVSIVIFVSSELEKPIMLNISIGDGPADAAY